MRTWILLTLLLALVSTGIQATNTKVVEFYPDMYLIQNQPQGFTECDYFSVTNHAFPYYNIFIDGVQIPAIELDDQEHTQLALQMLPDDKVEAFFNTYRVPNRMRAGNHTMHVSLCDHLDADGTALPVAQLKMDMICTPVHLPFYFQAPELCVCQVEPDTSTLLDREYWL